MAALLPPGRSAMSAFMVTTDCLQRVIVLVQSQDTDLKKHDPDLLGMMLLDLNRRALEQRYGGQFKPPTFRFVMPKGVPSLMQCYKSLRCFNYQCSEGDVPFNALYLRLATIEAMLAANLGHQPDGSFTNPSNKRAYDACKWGW